jgi:hypothetical protein
MKTKFVLYIALLMGCIACEIGDGHQGDTIHFSTRNVNFDAQGGEIVVTSEGNSWIIEGVNAIEGKYNMCGGSSYTYSDSTAMWNITGIEYCWLTITKEDAQTLVFSATPNITGVERSAGLSVSDHNYFGGITVTQSAE